MTKKQMIFVGRWERTNYVYSLNFDSAVSMVKRHFAFGNPQDNPYAVGDMWKTTADEMGWEVVAQEEEVTHIRAKCVGDPVSETAHILWECPFCKESYSDDLQVEERFPVLLICGCQQPARFMVARCKEEGNNHNLPASSSP